MLGETIICHSKMTIYKLYELLKFANWKELVKFALYFR